MTKTPNLNLNVPDYQDQRWDVPVNENWNLLDTALGRTVDYDNITNCITYIPQDIKLELNNGTLTLKAGSKVYIPNGAGVFDEVTIANDRARAGWPTGNVTIMLFYNRTSNSIQQVNISSIYSGITPSSNGIYYKTDSNQMYVNGDVTDLSLPIAICGVENGVLSSISQVFNGFGYIGSTVFALPGIKGLIPNGRNADGTLKSIKFTINSVLTLTGNGNVKGVGIYIDATSLQFYSRPYFVANELSDIPSNFAGIGYVISENALYTFSSGKKQNRLQRCVAGVYDWTDGIITSLTPKTPFHAVDYNDFAPVKAQVDTNTTALTTKANVGLDNLNADGQMIVDSQNGAISNCILEIPQNIKMEISGSNVIVKAGSVGVRPGSTYQTYTFASDYSFDYSSTPDGTYVFMVRVFSGGPLNIGFATNRTVSGETDSLAGTSYHTWFDTTNLQIKRYSSDLNNPDVSSMYPFAIINVENGVPSFAKDSNGNDMIFNGAGFIGTTLFVYPNIKGLIPNEFNEDGSLKSIEFTTNSIYLNTRSGIRDESYLLVKDQNGSISLSNTISSGNAYYNKEKNLFYDGDSYGTYTPILSFSTKTGGKIDKFTIRQPVRLATTEMLDNVQAQVDVNKTAISGKQDTLISGTNIKTINLTSLLGSGNISTTQSWGQITGTLSNQTDLSDALALKADLSMFQTAESVPSTFTDGVWLAVFETPLNS